MIARVRDRALDSPVHGERTASILGIALGVAFGTCFVTGVLSHLIQQPPSWFDWPSRPAGFYRITQGLHVATGTAAIPLLFAKLWAVYPKLFRWPAVDGVADAIERISLVPLVCGSVFMLFSGWANVARWYPWPFFFTTTHYWVAWITVGALVAHIGAKATIVRRALRKPTDDVPAPGTLGRRGFLAAAGGAAALLTLTTAGQTVGPLRRLVLFAPRRPDIGPQGIPVNKAAREAGVEAAASDSAYRLVVDGDVSRPLSLTLADLEALPQHEATLPIACVEGWSASAWWRGIRVRDLLERAGVPDVDVDEVTVRSLEANGLFAQSTLNRSHARDAATLLALQINGERLTLDHGFPVRLIGPNRPGVMQTKWVTQLTVRARRR